MVTLDGYLVTDEFFGEPYVDVDEARDAPVSHRYLHGGFEGTDTRFSLYFPSEGWQGRMLNPLQGGFGGSERHFGSPAGAVAGGLAMCARLGGYMVESNQGHEGDRVDPKAGDDKSIHSWRASAEVARLSKFVAAQLYGEAPRWSYVFGGSGGGRRSPLCLESAPDVWDGAMPYMGSDDRQVQLYGTMCNVQRVLGDQIESVVDATAPGGSGDPFVGLDSHQRDELAALYRAGFPRGNEPMIAGATIHITFWTLYADALVAQDPTYFEYFWTRSGYVGHDLPQLVERDLVDLTEPAARVVTVGELLADDAFAGPEFARMRFLVRQGARAVDQDRDLPVAIEVPRCGGRFRLGTTVHVTSGKAAGRRLYVTCAVGDLLLCSSYGEHNVVRFRGVAAGDEVHVSNRDFLAYCYFPRHHVHDSVNYDALRVDGHPVFAQHPSPPGPPLAATPWTGRYEGKLLWVHFTHDSAVWPPQAFLYRDVVRRAQGEPGAAERYRLRWVRHAEHVPVAVVPDAPGIRSSNTRLIDYQPVLEQSLADLIAWVEDGVAPPVEQYRYDQGGLVAFPESAAERAGIQPVVTVAANGAARAEVKAGEKVTLQVRAEVAPGAGSIVDVQWDVDGSGGYLYRDVFDGSAADVKLERTHVYSEPGTYFVTALVHSHRDGDTTATSRRIPDFGYARVVVT
jgi:hypothetical protein